MGSWKKLLHRMVTDSKRTGYTYQDCARVLAQLGFSLSPSGGSGSHRLWRRPRGDGTFARVGLVEKGHGTLLPDYVDDMVAVLRAERLLETDD